jgi:hypothetical protein
VAAYACNLSIWEIEMRKIRSLRPPGLHRDSVSKIKPKPNQSNKKLSRAFL